MSTIVSRRAFLQAAAAAGGVAALSAASGALASEVPADASALADGAVPPDGVDASELGDIDMGDMPAGGGGGMSVPGMSFDSSGYDPADYPDPASWRTKPEAIPDDQIVATHEADVVIVGEGHFGLNCAKYLCDHSDKKVIVIEKQDEESYGATGMEWTQLNSQFGFDHAGFPEYDPIEFQQNWMMATGNRANPTLVMNYAQYSGAATDAYLEGATEDDIAGIGYDYNDYRDVMMDHLGAYKFYTSCISCNNGCTHTRLHQICRDACLEKGAEWYFSMAGVQLLQDEDGAVTGVIAENQADGTYERFDASTAVVLATGGFGANGNMCLDLLGDLQDSLFGDELMSCMMDQDGSGIQMGYWAGGKIQPGPIATMNGRYAAPGDCQKVWLDEGGLRFTDEFFPMTEFRGRPTAFKPRDVFYIVGDATFPDNMVHCLPTHMTTEPSEENVQAARDSIDAAYAAGAEGSGGMYAADTLEEAFTYAGMDDEVKAAALAQVERYNEYCETGRDEEFGRNAEVLFPVSTPPFTVEVKNASVGVMMCTNGGLLTDGNGQVLGDDYRPIKGLFAGGNTGGYRFGDDYFTPGPGVSVGMCITLGYCTGKYIAENL